MDLKTAVKPISQESVATNASQLANMRHVIALAAGCAAGVLRLESLYGFGFYIATCLATTILLFLAVRSPSYYFTSPKRALLVDGVVPASAGYVLAWCLIYSLVET